MTDDIVFHLEGKDGEELQNMKAKRVFVVVNVSHERKKASQCKGVLAKTFHQHAS